MTSQGQKPCVSENGTFSGRYRTSSPMSCISQNGIYTCTYSIDAVSDEIRVISNVAVYKQKSLLFHLEKVPGSDIQISNSGHVVVYDMREHYKGVLTIHWYSNQGKQLFSRKFNSAALFNFSGKGSLFGVGSSAGVEIFHIQSGACSTYPSAQQFTISDDESIVALARENEVLVYSGSKLIKTFQTGFEYTRALCISADKSYIACIDKRYINLYSLADGRKVFGDVVDGTYSFRDLRFGTNQLWAGIHCKTEEESKGILRTYDFTGRRLTDETGEVTRILKAVSERIDNSKVKSLYPQVPWPFKPVDKAHDIYNNWEGLNTATDGDLAGCYLHQGVDMQVPVEEMLYSVSDGVVKANLTTGGAAYWRIAIADKQTADTSDGWMYAHLVQSSIQVQVDDQVTKGEYLGKIIFWYENWAHLHLTRIRDHGTTWSFTDDEWWIVYNPLLSLSPNTDTFAPKFLNVTTGSKFAFCDNTQAKYLSADKLSGDVDIIVKISDSMDVSTWSQPAFALYYWVKRVSDNAIAVPRTLSQIANHAYPFYNADKYKPFAGVMYKFDNTCVPGGWFNRKRGYHHIVTNTNGDSLITLGEKDSCLHTAKFNDGKYRIYVEAFDSRGNATIDSQEVTFSNGVSGLDQPGSKSLLVPQTVLLSGQVIQFSLKAPALVAFELFNTAGKVIFKLKPEQYSAGQHTVSLKNNLLACQGMHLLRITMGQQKFTHKVFLP